MENQPTYYVVITEGQMKGQRYKIREGEISLGRHISNDICIGQDGLIVSKNHALLIKGPNGIAVEDCKSTNGTYINGKKIEQTILKVNDIIGLGRNGPKLRLIEVMAGQGKQNSLVAASDSSSSDTIDLDLSKFDKEKKVHQGTFDTTKAEYDFSDITPTNKKQEKKDNDKDKKSDTDQTRSDATFTSLSLSKTNPDTHDHQAASPEPDNRMAISPDLTGTFDLSDNPLSLFDESETKEKNKDRNEESKDAFFKQDIGSTMEIKARLKDEILKTKDIKLLVKDSEKRDKIMKSDQVSTTQKHMINKFVKTYQSMRLSMMIIFGSVIIVVLVVLLFFSIGYFKYRNLLKRGLSIEEQLDRKELQIEKISNAETVDQTELAKLYRELEEKQQKLDSIKNVLDLKDHGRFFTDTVEYFIDAIMKEFKETNYHIPPQMLTSVKRHIDRFSGPMKKSATLILSRKDQYFPEIQRVFGQYKLPGILAYVSIQESALNPSARSHAGAVGLWQFIKGTGKRYGLEINDNVDERLDWRKSTVAAAKYLHKLISLFGKGSGVLLAVAAYNAGEHKIERELAKVDNPLLDHDFWYLYRTSKSLAHETREYVPQILAWIIIDSHRELYGFEN